MIVELTREELQKCNEFAYKCAQNQQSIEFGQSDTIPRSANEIGRDNLIGKIAEVAFAKMMLQDFNIKIELDFEYYPRGEWDDQDTIINDWKIDVKGTRQGGKWMLIEWSRRKRGVALLSPRKEQRTATPTAQGFVWLLRTVIKASISGLRR